MSVDDLRPGDFVSSSVRLVSKIAQGGMGTVWLAEHLVLDTRVVVKLMAPELERRPDVLARFAREAMIAAQVKSPHVVQVFDSGTTEAGIPYIVMELLEGHDLDKHLARGGPMTPQAFCPILLQVARALSKAHRVGVVHRDIKPENIFLCDTDGGEPFVKLLDFGTAKAPDARDSRMTSTDTGQVLGTPLYMSPEQIVGDKQIDGRTDIWSLGVVAFEALTGKVPFEGATMAALALAIHGDPPRMTDARPELSRTLDVWFARACARDVEARFPTAREAADAFVHAVTGGPMLEPFETIRPPSVTSRSPTQPARILASDRPVQLAATLPRPGSERRNVNIAFAVVAAAAALAVVGIVTRSSSHAAATDEAPVASAAPAPPPPAPVPPPSPSPPAATATATAKEEPLAHAQPPPAAHPPAPPKPNPPMTKGPRATVTRPARASRAATSRASTNPDDDLVRLSNIDAGAAPPPPPAATATATAQPAAPAPPPMLDALPDP